ncbi:MAG: DNA polymerase III subunit gamma/tau [Geobacteraceae bacterium]|nr:DNA polymerase III subunit gamma/tau [Geobacteraceae bacterium]
MSYLVLARKWRPQTFSDLIGQEHVCRTLQNAIGSGRVAHAFLFTGARGVGKTSAARILAKALQCENGPAAEPCNECPSCSEITAGTSVDVFEIDGASNTGVEDIRELRENIRYLPSRCRFKIFIIDEVHMLSTNAFNALLKTLEEPPPHVKFIFATTEPHKVPITILSRCQRFDFKRIALPKIVDRLRNIVDEEKVTISDVALTAIARKGDGSMRDSLSTLDQVLAFCGESVDDEEVIALLGIVDRRLLLDTSGAVFARDCAAVLDTVAKVDSYGCNIRHFCQELIDHFRNLTITKVTESPSELLDVAESEMEALLSQAGATTLDDLQRHLAILLKAEAEMAVSGFSRLILEMALLRMCTIAPVVPVDEILSRLKALQGLESGTVPMPAGSQRVISRQSAPAVPSGHRRETHPAPATPRQSEPGEGGWAGFVAFVNSRRKSLGALLEHGRPLQFTAECVEIGYPAGSFQLSCMKDQETLASVKELAGLYWKGAPDIKITSLNGGGSGLPQSVREKRNLEEEKRKREMEDGARSNPVVSAALEIFGGEIGEVLEIGQDKDAKEDED